MFRNIIFSVSLISVLALSTAHARAADESSSGDDAKYRATLKEALAEYDANHFEEARILFRRAHELNPNARTLRSIGMASFELRDYVAALRALTAALVETRKPLNAEQRAHAQGLLEKSRMFVDVYTLRVTPADARVLLDGRPLDQEPDGTILLGFGNHTFEASKSNYTTRALPVNVRGGEHKDLAMTLERKTSAVAPPVAPVSTLTTPTPVAPVKHGFTSTAWFLGAGGAALLSAGAGFGWWYYNRELTTCNNPPLAADGTSQECHNKSDLLLVRNLAVGGTIAAGAAAITMAVIGFVTHEPAGENVASSGLHCVPTPSGVWCQRSF
jgi:tetratricopeptide (TPR) repeat protein